MEKNKPALGAAFLASLVLCQTAQYTLPADSVWSRFAVGAFMLLGSLLLLPKALRLQSSGADVGLTKWLIRMLIGAIILGTLMGLFIPSLVHRPTYWMYLAGDLMSMIWFLCCIAGLSYCDIMAKSQIWTILLLMIGPIAAIFITNFAGVILDDEIAYMDYHISVFFLVLQTVAWIRRRYISAYLLGLPVGICMYLHLMSWQRATLIGFIFAILVSYVIIIFSKTHIIVKMLRILSLAAVTICGVIYAFSSAGDSARIFKTFDSSNGLDASTSSRFDEASDALSTMGSSNVVTYVTGMGHGSVYVPEISEIGRNFTEEGYVHNIHLGPMMFFFRYGIIGVIIFALCALVIILTTWRIIKVLPNVESAGLQIVYLYSYMMTLVCMLYLLTRNVTILCTFAYFLAVLLYFHRRYGDSTIKPQKS